MVSPWTPISQPTPPPRVSPPTPVVEIWPPVIARRALPWPDRRAPLAPAADAGGPPLGIDPDLVEAARSSTSPPSVTPCPATEWPPPLAAT